MLLIYVITAALQSPVYLWTCIMSTAVEYWLFWWFLSAARPGYGPAYSTPRAATLPVTGMYGGRDLVSECVTATPTLKLSIYAHYDSPPPLTKFVGHIGITASMCLYFVQMISPELLNFLLPNLVWWYIILSRSVLQKYWSIFKVKVTARAYIFQIWLFLPYLLNLICLQPNLVWW